jgi:NADH-quinone oxidoreductase subunit L
VATDIKRVLAYSTISQLGYMMLAIGVAGWGAGLFHLITHAFFKSLMFLSSGSVIVGCHHEQDMSRMGGLRRKMPITALTMLVGVIAISGLAVPGMSIAGEKIAFSGYHSKDAIVATALAFKQINPVHFLLFFVPLLTAGITAFYMFRLWFFTFAGQPRDPHVYEHAQESPWVMTGPLIVLSVFAAFVAFGGEEGPLYKLLSHSEPAGVAAGVVATAGGIALPGHHDVHAVHSDAGTLALLAAFAGLILAFLLYGLRAINPADIARQLRGLHGFLVEKWQFDNLYDAVFVRPVLVVSRWFAAFDRNVIDGFLHTLSRVTIDVSQIDRRFDEGVVDGLVNVVGDGIFAAGRSLRVIQTGKLRQYVMFIAIGLVALFMLLLMFFPQ